MSDPVTWYTLPRTILDLGTIQEKIDEKVLGHNVDPSAHGQTNESLWEHRIDPILDHLQYSIYNIKMAPTTRAFKAFVGPSATGDFEDLQEAINYVNIHGGGKIYILAGTYVLSADIVLYSNIHLVGEDADTAILDFNNTANGIRAVGTSGSHLHNVRIEGLKVINSENDSDGAVYFYYVDDSEIENCYFKDNNGSGDPMYDIWAKNCERCRFRNNRHENSDDVYVIEDSTYTWIENNYITATKKQVAFYYQSDKQFFKFNTIVSNEGSLNPDGLIKMSTSCDDYVISGNQFYNAKDTCIYIEDTNRATITGNIMLMIAGASDGVSAQSSNRLMIVGNIIKNADNDGVYLTDTDRCVITGNASTNHGGFGVNVSDNTCNENTIVGNCLDGNTGGATQDLGVGTVIASNS